MVKCGKYNLDHHTEIIAILAHTKYSRQSSFEKVRAYTDKGAQETPLQCAWLQVYACSPRPILRMTSNSYAV